MKSGETKDINVKFPENYQSKELAGKEATFTVTLHSFKEKTEPKLDDEMIKRLLPGDESASKEKIIENIKKEIEYDKLMELYNKKLKPEFIENLVKNYNFDLPKNIVEQEIDAQLNQKAQNMSEKELEEYRNNPEKLKELRESLREDAVNSVKATFLIDTLAKYVVDLHQMGESVKLKVWRDKKEIELNIPLTKYTKDVWLVKLYQYDKEPTYFIYGGYVFSPLLKILLYKKG